MLLYLFLLIATTNSCKSFDKIIIWGHKLHTHTHSYVHNAFYRAFEHMGFKTYWFDDNDNVSTFDFSNSLFVTEGQVDKNIPIRDDCHYILHYCRSPKYHSLINKGHCIILHVYNDVVLKRTDLVKMDACIYYDLYKKCIYMPWGTDLLPYEIDNIKSQLPAVKRKPIITWVGTYGDGLFGNIQQLLPFQKACEENNFVFQYKTRISPEENQYQIAQSYMAPAIVGKWQQEVGYIPCRIFKNISYGQLGITNSRRVYELLDGKVVYNPDTYQLFYDAKKRIETVNIEEIYELMDIVKTKHTYINRIQSLLEFLELVEKTYANE